jgi:soluble lytic murein transglycosylase
MARVLKRILMITAISAIAVFCAVKVINFVLPVEYDDIIEKYSEQYGLEEALVYAVINAESRFRPGAESSAGAFGLMQMTKPTADWAAEMSGHKTDYEEKGLSNPEVSIAMGCWYLAYLSERFEDERTALAAYNAGQGRVAHWLSQTEYSNDGKTLQTIPFRETRDYVSRVSLYKRCYKVLFGVRKMLRN